MSPSSSMSQKGFTLIELLICIAILSILMGVVYLNLGPVRERGRETRCISNFHQIAQAIQMYRQDYNGIDPPAATTVAEAGLPYTPPQYSLQPYIKSSEVFRCESEFWPNEPDFSKVFDYMWNVLPDERAGSMPIEARFSFVIAKRGIEMPLMIDPHHGSYNRMLSPPPAAHKMLVLRLSGQVETVQVSTSNTFEW